MWMGMRLELRLGSESDSDSDLDWDSVSRWVSIASALNSDSYFSGIYCLINCIIDRTAAVKCEGAASVLKPSIITFGISVGFCRLCNWNKYISFFFSKSSFGIFSNDFFSNNKQSLWLHGPLFAMHTFCPVLRWKWKQCSLFIAFNAGGIVAFGGISSFLRPMERQKVAKRVSIRDLWAYKLEKPTAAVSNRQSAAFAGQDGEDDEALTAWWSFIIIIYHVQYSMRFACSANNK